MKGKTSAEAKAELEKSGMSGDELEKILAHKVIIFSVHVVDVFVRRSRRMIIRIVLWECTGYPIPVCRISGCF